MNYRSFLFLVLTSFLVGCDKNYFTWELEKKLSVPIVSTLSIDAAYATSAAVKIQLDFNGNGTITKFGVCYGLQTDPDISSPTQLIDAADTAQTVLITGLTPNTTYYARAFAENEIGIAYGSTLSFSTTATSAPAVNTTEAQGITINSAQVGGIILSDGGLTITNKGVCYSSTSASPTTSGNTINAGSGNNAFTANLSGLQNNTTYYARSFATNSMGTSYGQTISFTTLSVPDALVQTNNCNSLSGLNAVYTVWQGSGYQNLPMCIATSGGYSGSCLNDCVSNALGASVEFTRTFSTSGHLRFRSRCYDGNSIRIPTVSIDGQSVSTTDLTPNNFAYDWHYLKTTAISSGQHTIRINWSQVSVYYDYSIDEIEFWE